MSPRIACLVFAVGASFAAPAFAQTPAPATPPAAAAAAAPRAPFVSPEVAADRRVTFRLGAPNATNVAVVGQWDNNQVHPMTKDAAGVWSITLGPIEPSFWIYNFRVDGIDIADPFNPLVKLRMRTSASLVSVPATPAAIWDVRSDIPHGSVETHWHNSAVAGEVKSFLVYTPPDYATNPTARYPVFYLLHGNNGTPADWTHAGRAHFMADALIAAKKIRPMIIVMPHGHAVPFGGPNTQNNAIFERHLLEEVIPAVEARYRVAAGRDNRAIMGLSMGGGQALRIGLAHLDQFAAVGGYSAATVPDFEERFKALLADPAGTNAKLKVLWIGCGKQDSLFAANERVAGILAKNQIRHTWVARDGFHDYFFWRRCFEETTMLLFRDGASGSD